MSRQLMFALGAALFVLAGGAGAPAQSQAPKPLAKMTYVLPMYLRPTGSFAQDVASLKQRFPEGKYVRVGFTHYIFISMDKWDVDPTDRAAVRAALSSTITQIDTHLANARANDIAICFSFLTAIRERYDPVQADAERADRRNTSWYMDNGLANGWISHSRYARKFRAVLEAYVREIGTVLANRMARYPSTIVASSGDGEVELSYDRSPIVNPAYTEQNAQLADYSPFAIAEFRDWLRNGGMYAPGQPFAGHGFEKAARYQGDASPATDTNGDGHTVNGDFGTALHSWNLRYFDWSLNDPIEGDPNSIPSFVYEASSFHPLPDSDPSRFDAPRVRRPGHAWWEVWDLFRQTMVWRYNVDFARWMTTTVDADTKQTVPVTKWFSHQIPADYLFGGSPENPNYRLVTSASPYWTADISPYGSFGMTSFNVNLGGGNFALTARNVVPEIAKRNVRWSILEWHPAVPVSNSFDVYDAEMALMERYRPYMLVPYGWGDPYYQVESTPFEITLRDLINRIKDGRTSANGVRPSFAPLFLAPGQELGPRPLGAEFARRIPRDPRQ